MSALVDAVLLAPNSVTPRWIKVDANASGPLLSDLLNSSQPECIALSPSVLMWYDATPFCSVLNRIGKFMHAEPIEQYTGSVLLVCSIDPRTLSDESSGNDDQPCNCALQLCHLEPLFNEKFIKALQR